MLREPRSMRKVREVRGEKLPFSNTYLLVLNLSSLFFISPPFFGGVDLYLVQDIESHPARGAWIEINATPLSLHLLACRTPQGVRGLKCEESQMVCAAFRSHPARGAWIEMAWYRRDILGQRSHPARGAWIEISLWYHRHTISRVAPRKGCVD